MRDVNFTAVMVKVSSAKFLILKVYTPIVMAVNLVCMCTNTYSNQNLGTYNFASVGVSLLYHSY